MKALMSRSLRERGCRFGATVLVVFSAAASACVTENATAVDGAGPCDGGCVKRREAGTGTGEARGEGGRAGAGGTDASGGTAAPGGRGPADTGTGGDATTNDGSEVPGYALVVDAPADGATVRGSVRVRGRAPGYRNVEVWDRTHKMPPLTQVTPGADGAFSTTVDTTALSPGPTTWTVWAWDSPPGTAYNHNASVPLDLTIEGVLTPDI
jgi:hypothetical protein